MHFEILVENVVGNTCHGFALIRKLCDWMLR